jgi:hypothetical protein
MDLREAGCNVNRIELTENRYNDRFIS